MVFVFFSLTYWVYMWEKNKNTNLKRYTHLNVHSRTIYSSQAMKGTQVPIDRWMGKEDMVHIHIGILLSHKNNTIVPFTATWMDLENIVLCDLRSGYRQSVYPEICSPSLCLGGPTSKMSAVYFRGLLGQSNELTQVKCLGWWLTHGFSYVN